VWNRRVPWIALLLLSLCAPAGAGATTWLRPLFLKRSSYGESFTFLADLDDGTYLHLQLSITNLGPGPTKGICRGLLVPKQGGPWKASARFARESVTWVDGAEERLSMGTCSAWAGSSSSGVEVTLEGTTVRITFAEHMRLVSPHDAPLAVGEERYQTEVLLYRAPVSATIAFPGQPARDVSGAGYLDHSRSTVPPKELANRWIRFRALRGQRGLLLLGREGKDGRFAPLWACADPAPCRAYRSFHVQRGGTGKEPTFLIAVADEGDPIELSSGRLLYRDAPIDELGVIGKLVTPFTGSPVTYVYRGTARAGAGRPVDGVLEVELADE
jgi:hypothetical protein